jgi:hypothetical protein
MGVEVMLLLLERISIENTVVALGFAERPANWCEDDEGELPCWVTRILMVIREATDVDEERIQIDPNRLVKTLGAMGDDFRRRHEWRWYFHLTIGLGEMLSFLPAAATESGEPERRFLPLIAEQVGIGYASPAFAGDRFTFKLGLFGSGLLYRIAMDSEESDAVMFGGFVALDLYELLEIYVAPMALFYPPGSDTDLPPSFAVAAGLSVPLGDYLSEL